MATIESPDVTLLNKLRRAMELAFQKIEECWEEAIRVGRVQATANPLEFFTGIKVNTLKQYDYLIQQSHISLANLNITRDNLTRLAEGLHVMFDTFRNEKICAEEIKIPNTHFNNLQEYIQGEIERFRSVSPNSARGGRRLRKIRRSNRRSRNTRKTRRSKKNRV